MLKRLALVASTVALVVAAPVAAQADPTNGLTFTLDCGDAGTFEIVTPPTDADWTPALLLDSQQTFRPTSLGPFTFTGVLPDGTVIEPETDPEVITKPGRVNPNREVLECEASATFTIEEGDPEAPAGTVVTISGTVEGWFTGRPA